MKPGHIKLGGMQVSRSKRGPERSKPVRVGNTPVTKAVRRDLFYPSGSLKNGRPPR